MALSARERQVLDGIARRARAEDPVFAHRLTTFGGRFTVARRRRLLPFVLVVIVAALGVLFLPQGTAHGRPGPGPDGPAPGGQIARLLP
jgi:hypothetical protein